MARVERVASLLRQEIAAILQRKISDSRIGFISITDVEVTKDYSVATVYYSQLGSDADKEKTRKGLGSASKFVHYELGKSLNYLQSIPRIRFRYDDGIDRGTETLSKLNNLASEDAAQ
jgi:ribosome-binding factor A